ncbi:MAG: spore coat associated protein CotJA [Clostridiales bacterium]|nr:spore coat associated protein CotJA [Clostridiales bacterium]MCD7872705.1 spore coat associated protein CotJA [Clostridiales bacterium]
MQKFEDMFNPSFLNAGTENILPPLPEDATVTMAYIPYQQAPVIYENQEKGLNQGTIFPELDKPFTGKGELL